MARQKIKNTFLKGMNQDRSWAKVDPQQYKEASNVRLLTDDMGDTMGSISTVRGNLFDFAIPNTSEVYLLTEQHGLEASLDGSSQTFNLTLGSDVGSISYGANDIDKFYEQVAEAINSHVSSGTYDSGFVAQANDSGIIIYSSTHKSFTHVVTSSWSVGVVSGLDVTLKAGKTENLQVIGQTRLRELAILWTCPKVPDGSGQIWKVEWDNQDVPTITLVRNGSDNYNILHDIDAEGRYELPLVQRVYWTDFNNALRSLNVFSDTSFLDRINTNPEVKFDIPVVQDLSQVGGSLTTGWYIYGYRYLNLGGSETSFSQFSQPFPIMTANEESEAYESFTGNASGAATSKSLKVKIDNLDNNFGYIDIVAGYMKDLNSSPIFSFVEEGLALSGSDSLEFIHSEVSSNILSKADIAIPDTTFTKCKTITIKDNRLLAGNVIDDTVDIDIYDANSFRYTQSTNTADYSSNSNKRNPLNKDSTAYASWKSDNDQNAFQEGTSVLGGTGAEIDFKFVTHDVILDSTLSSFPSGSAAKFEVTPNAANTTLNGKTIPMGGSKIWNSFKNPFVASHFRGYTRSEVYRFGVVFFDKSGRALDAKWIADIRMPEASQSPVFSKSGNNLKGHALGVEFSVNIPSVIKDNCSGFSIVRAERTASDRSIAGQGMMFDIGFHNIKRDDIDDKLYGHSYRVDRHTGYGASTNNSAAKVFPLMGELHTLSVPELLITNQSIDLTPYKIRPVVGLNDRDSSMNGSVNVDGDPVGANNHTFSFGKYYATDSGGGGATRYFENVSSTNNYDSLNMDILDSEFLPGMQASNPTAGELLTGTPWNNTYVGTSGPGGFMNYAAPRYDSDAVGEREWTSGDKQIQFRGRGGFAHFINVSITKWRNAMCTQPADTGVQTVPQTNSRILRSNSYEANVNKSNRIQVKDVNTSGGDANIKMLFNLYAELPNQYGGDNINDIENTTYISTGHYQAIDSKTASTVTATVYGGDTYINIHDEVQTYANENSGAFANFNFKETNDGSTEFQAQGFGIMYPVESVINLDWRQAIHMNNVGTSSGYSSANFINYGDNLDSLRSPSGITESWETRQNDAFDFFSTSSFSLTTNEWDNRVWASDNKINGEATDSWRTFRVNNFWDVDGNLGPINKLVTFNDQVMYFQDRAFGKLVVNPNPLLVGSDGVTLALGKGGTVLQDNSYISTNIGTKHQWSVFTSPRSVYWFDIVNKKPYRYSPGGISEMSDIKGMHSFFIENVDNSLLNIDNPANKLGIRGVYDELNNEALFTFLTAKTTYASGSGSYNTYKDTLIGGIVPERSQVTYLEFKTILDDSGNTVSSINVPVTFDVIKEYPIDPGSQSLIPTTYRTTEYLKRRPTYRSRDFTLCFSEITDAWSSFYDFAPTIYIDTKSRLISPNPNFENRLHLHNVGSYNKWYGDDFKTHLEVVSNVGPEITKVFDNVSWHTVSQSKSGALGKKLDQLTFDKYYAYNDYQHTGEAFLDLSAPTPLLRRVEREWQMAIPRNIVTESGSDIDVLNPINWDFSRVFNDRIRDKYLVQHFEFDNKDTDKFTINYVNTLVRLSRR